MLDIDHFKKVNDTFDTRRATKSSGNLLPAQDVASRKKRTSWPVTAVRVRPDPARRRGRRVSGHRGAIRRTVEKKPFDVGAIQLKLTVSLGISRFPDDRAGSKEELSGWLNLALYDAKRGGRNQVCNFQGEQRTKEAEG